MSIYSETYLTLRALGEREDLAAWAVDAEIQERAAKRRKEQAHKPQSPGRDEPEYTHERIPEMADNQTVTNDPYESANEATVRPRDYYGQIHIDAWFCILQKGVGKVSFDPQQHNVDQRCTAITMSMIPLPDMNITFKLERETIAESREWAGIILPSIKAAGIASVKDANGKFAKMQQVPTGRKYRTSTGEEREATTFKVLAFYSDEAACRQAYYAETGKAPDGSEPIPGFDDEPAKPAANIGAAKQFILAFAKQKNYDLDATREVCRQQPMITNAIDVDSDEFTQIVAEGMAQAA